MKSRQLSRWLIAFSLIAVCAIVFLSEPWQGIGDEFDKLISGDVLKSDEIVLVRDLDTLDFSKVDTSWFNGQGDIVSREMVENMIFAVDRMQKKSIVGEEEIMGCDYGVKVIFRKKGRDICVFLFSAGNLGEFISAEGSGSGYGVEIPGFENISLRKVFSANRDHYHLHLLIDLMPSEISEVEVWPLGGGSFRIIQDQEYNLRVTVGESSEDIVGELSEHKLRMLLTYFNSIRYDAQLGEVTGELDAAIAKVWVKDFSGKEMELQVFPFYNVSGEVDLYKAVVKYNNKEGFLLMEYYYLDLLIRDLAYYR